MGESEKIDPRATALACIIAAEVIAKEIENPSYIRTVAKMSLGAHVPDELQGDVQKSLEDTVRRLLDRQAKVMFTNSYQEAIKK